MNKFEYLQSASLDKLLPVLQEPDTAIKAGGVDIIDLMKEGLTAPSRLVSLRPITALQKISLDDDLSIGAGATIADISNVNNIYAGPFRVLAQACASLATPQIRHAATIGGNLCQRPRCWYFRSHEFDCTRKGGKICYAMNGENAYHAIFGNTDGCVIVHPSSPAVALTALDARLKIKSSKGERELAMDQFFITPANDITKENALQPGEVITEIYIPEPPNGTISFYLRQNEKQSFDWPIAEIAVALAIENNICRSARIVLGAAAPIPWRCTDAENLLIGQTITKESAACAAKKALSNATPLSKNAYKISIFETVIRRALCFAVGIDPLR
ncbi:MAG TPA: FAD binding domain-containing protein [bacterium]|nr:FAD binding domain-containing protein [bacterium]HMZ04023.1 FAD binding domain-containing protein [bacterium]HNB55635.1 FAD binding domain-containing protein [bacterium]HNC47754.1 FAD binding domain-containing protein [bacterium]HND76719.1 FAD binding domain-containing protein [bacterium]